MDFFQQMVLGQHISLFTRAFIALLLLTAGISKLGSRRDFISVVRNYMLLPERVADLVGRYLPIAEVIVGVSLLLGLLMPWPVIAASGLFLLFGSAVAINLLRGRVDISCGCFGFSQEDHLTWWLVIRNLALAGIAILLLLNSLVPSGTYFLPVEETLVNILTASAVLAAWWVGRAALIMWRWPEHKR